MDNIDYTHDTLFCMLRNSVGFSTFVVPLCCVTHISHVIYTGVSV